MTTITPLQIQETKLFLEKRIGSHFELGLIFGTGLGSFTQLLTDTKEVSFHEIPNFPQDTSGSSFHKGKMVAGTYHGKRILCMHGRFHYYEGISLARATFPVRVMKALSVSRLIITNAGGGLNPAIPVSGILLAEDHIHLIPDNPLIGLSDPQFGDRFPSMHQPYAPALSAEICNAAIQTGVHLHRGIYISVAGPSLETRAEYRMLRLLGGDVVGMSSTSEAIVCNQIGLPCAMLSVVTDLGHGTATTPTTLEEILDAASVGDKQICDILCRMLEVE